VLAALRDHTGESAQLYRRQGDQRICGPSRPRQGFSVRSPRSSLLGSPDHADTSGR
jgi:DNA-binding IclR family transcriptional regulator